MTDDRFAPRLPQLMHELAGSDESYIDDILAKTSRTRQRPAWTFASHWLPTPTALETLPANRNRLIIAFLLVSALAILLAGAAFLAGRRPPVLPRSDAANGWIAVSANRAGLGDHFGDIYLLSEGDTPRRIIGSDGDALAQACPQFSPDGQRLAYGEADNFSLETNERGRWPVANRAVVVVGLDDNGDASPPIIHVALPTDPGEIPCPEWSPDGTRIAYKDGSELRVTDATSGKTSTFQTAAAAWGLNDLQWSRDGTRIAVSEPGQIRIVPVDGSATSLISTGPYTPASLGWLAGDDRILYMRADDVGGFQSVNIVGTDGRNDIEVSTQRIRPLGYSHQNAVVSPDGMRIAYAQQTFVCSNDTCTGGPPRLQTADPDGSNVAVLPIPATEGPPYGLQWSPDGKRLLFGSIASVVSVAAAPDAPAIYHSNGELDMEWTASEVTWQPVYP
jgi:Tol biopolymer transport system component